MVACERGFLTFVHCNDRVLAACSAVKPLVSVTVYEEIAVAKVPLKPLVAEQAVVPSVIVTEAGKRMSTLALAGIFCGVLNVKL